MKNWRGDRGEALVLASASRLYQPIWLPRIWRRHDPTRRLAGLLSMAEEAEEELASRTGPDHSRKRRWPSTGATFQRTGNRPASSIAMNGAARRIRRVFTRTWSLNLQQANWADAHKRA